MKLSEKLIYWRAERPDEWQMDVFIRDAERLEKEDQLDQENKLLRDALIQIQDICYNPRQNNLSSISKIGNIAKEALDND